MSGRRADLRGTYVVMVTPFTPDGALDEPAVRALIRILHAEGAEGIVVAGSSGEWFSLGDDERIRLFEIAVEEEARGQMRLIAGVSAIATDQAIRLADAARRLGYDAGLLLPPPYVLPTRAELIGFIGAVDAVGLDLMLYNNPARTGVNLDAGVLKELLRFSHVVALKESAKDLQQITRTLREVGDELCVFSGMENYLVPSLNRGAVGVVAMAPNVLGREAMRLFDAAKRGEMAVVDRVQTAIDLLYGEMYGGHSNPYVVMKEAMRMRGRPGGAPRPPLLPMAPAARDHLAGVLKAIDLVLRAEREPSLASHASS